MAASIIVIIFLIVLHQGESFVFEDSGFCRYFSQVNCSQHGSGSLCGSNGVTYVNHRPPIQQYVCAFTKAHCDDSSVTIQQTGPCQVERIKQDLVLSLVCNDILAMDCTTYQGTTSYCATNGVTYSNVCAFERARCYIDDLFLDHLGPCKNGRKPHGRLLNILKAVL